MKLTQPDWEQFERAVAAFAAAMDPRAIVKHDIRLPDRHHGGSRQRDVWIEAKICGHYPVSVLVSCKHFKRKLHSGDIDAFNGELASSQARVGVLYSCSGFTKPAVQKAKVLGIPCCRLYRREPPEIPSVLTFTAYCCAPQIVLHVSPFPAPGWDLDTWQDLFDQPVIGPNGNSGRLLDRLVSQYHDAEKTAVSAVADSKMAPQSFQAEVMLPSTFEGASPLRVVASGQWKHYRAKLEAYEVNGSYEFTGGDFKGQIATPWVDRLSSEPGPGWERIDQPPQIRPNLAMVILHRGDAKSALLQNLAQKRLNG